MRHIARFLAFLVLLMGLAAARAQRQTISLDPDWRFHLGDLPGAQTERPGIPITDWQWQPVTLPQGKSPATAMLLPGAMSSEANLPSPWRPVKTGADIFNGRVGFAILRTILPNYNNGVPTLHFEGVDDNGAVFLNGKQLAYHEGWNESFDVDLKKAWKPNGPNVCVVIVENTAGPGGITAPASLVKSGSSPIVSAATAPNYPDHAWRIVRLPHDYVVEGKFSPTADGSHGYLPVTVAWYRKHFRLPTNAKNKSLWIDFDGIYRDSRVWLNGHYLGRHESGYTSFRYDVTPYANPKGDNVLTVFVDPRHFEGWWYEGGGIYRHVRLVVADKTHLTPWGTVVTTKLTEPKPGARPMPASVFVHTDVTNSSARPQHLTLRWTISGSRERYPLHFTAKLTVPAGSRKTGGFSTETPDPWLWSLEDPHLYSLETQILRDGKVIDDDTTTFGIRTVRFDPNNGLFLNGKRVKIQGTCNHQDFAGLGIAVPDNFEYWRVAKLKDMGANAWRMSHNPPTPALLDACDRLGMLVMDENRRLGDNPSVLGEVADMVQRDRNHPSIIMWSMCNEEAAAGTKRGGEVFRHMMDTVHKYDQTRPVTCAMNSGWFGDGITDVEDLMGVNYNYEVYDRFHREHPDMPLYGSETASTLTTRGQYEDNKARTFVSSYNMTDGSWQPAGERPFVAGTFVWTGFDYKGEPTPYGWPDINSHFGIMDMCGFPKDNYYYYLSWWKTAPVAHIMPHWNWPGKEGQPIHVVVFSNATKVGLFLNRSSVGLYPVPRLGHIDATVNYEPGTLEARGYDSRGRVVAFDVLQTTGKPAALLVHLVIPAIMREEHRLKLRPNGEDVAAFEVDVVDSQGRIVPDAENLVRFTVGGDAELAGVGNGNPSDHDPDKASYRHAFAGKCMVLVRMKSRPGHAPAFTVTAESKGLTPKEAYVESVDH